MAGPAARYRTSCPRHRYTRFGRDVAGEWDGMPSTMDDDVDDVGLTADVVNVNVKRSRALRRHAVLTSREGDAAGRRTMGEGGHAKDETLLSFKSNWY